MLLMLPWSPSVNHYWRQYRGRMLLSAAGRAYRQQVSQAVFLQAARTPLLPLTGRLAVTVVAHAPDRRKRDIDNLFKAIGDSLAHAGVYVDDAQIDDLHLIRGAVHPKDGHVLVTITQIGDVAP